MPVENTNFWCKTPSGASLPVPYCTRTGITRALCAVLYYTAAKLPLTNLADRSSRRYYYTSNNAPSQLTSIIQYLQTSSDSKSPLSDVVSNSCPSRIANTPLTTNAARRTLPPERSPCRIHTRQQLQLECQNGIRQRGYGA